MPTKTIHQGVELVGGAPVMGRTNGVAVTGMVGVEVVLSDHLQSFCVWPPTDPTYGPPSKERTMFSSLPKNQPRQASPFGLLTQAW